jgi:hypothetical protein
VGRKEHTVFGVLFWIFLVIGLAVAVLGFTSIYSRVDEDNGESDWRSEK